MRRTPRTLDAAGIDAAARRYLQTRFTSRAWLGQLLLRRVERATAPGSPERAELERAVEATLDRLVEHGALDDAAYARSKVRSLVRRGVSTPGLKARLAAKGLEAEEVQNALGTVAEEAEQDLGWAAACAYVRRRRLGPYRLDTSREAREKDLTVLARAGFPYALARRVLDASAEEIEGGRLG